MSNPTEKIPALVSQLYEVVRELERQFEGRRFTPDGHLVGSIGEVIAAHDYGLTLLTASAAVHDAKTDDGRLVQIKATQSKSVALRAQPDFLLVLLLDSHGKTSEIFNGPGHMVWHACGPMQKNGQRQIGIAKLRKLMATVPENLRIQKNT